MTPVSTAYERSGRSRQKQRTRNDLIAAARTLIAETGVAPTIEDTAAAASVSRTTAYRYFRSRDDLFIAAYPETDRTTLLPDDIGDDPETRLLEAVDSFHRSMLLAEPQHRTMLRLALEDRGTPTSPAQIDELPLRKGRGIGWFEDALSPLLPELGEAGVRRLAIGVRSAVGIESLVWLVDVAGLDREEATDLMRATALALLHAALLGRPD